MAGFTVTIDDRDMRRLASDLRAMPQKIPAAVAASINAALNPAKKVIVKGLESVTTLPKGRILKGTDIIKASKARLAGTVKLQGRTVGAIEFKHRFTPVPKHPRGTKPARGTGLSVQFDKGGPFVFFGASGRAFKAAGRSGNIHWFFRKGKKRLPIDSFKGPSLLTVFRRNPKIIADATAAATAAFRKRLYSQIDRFLVRGKTAIPALDSLT